MYITAEILNEVINALKREFPDVEVIQEVVYFISFCQLMRWSLQWISMLLEDKNGVEICQIEL